MNHLFNFSWVSDFQNRTPDHLFHMRAQKPVMEEFLERVKAAGESPSQKVTDAGRDSLWWFQVMDRIEHDDGECVFLLRVDREHYTTQIKPIIVRMEWAHDSRESPLNVSKLQERWEKGEQLGSAEEEKAEGDAPGTSANGG